jgi:chromosome segregation ATPase
MWITFGASKETKRAIRDLTDRIEQLERDHKALELEWNETYDKVRHALSRIAKRDARAAEKAAGDTNGAEDIPGQPDGLDPISRAVLARRQLRRPS